MKFLLHDPHIFSLPRPLSVSSAFAAVRTANKGEPWNSMHEQLVSGSPQSMSDLEREGTGGGSVTSGISRGDSAQKIGVEHDHAHNYLAPRGEKWLWRFFCLTIYTGGVFTSPRVFRISNTVVSNWRNGKCIFLPLFSTMDESISFGLGRRGAELTWILLEGVCMFFLRFEGWKLWCNERKWDFKREKCN